MVTTLYLCDMDDRRQDAIDDMIQRYQELEESLTKMKAISNGSPLCKAVIESQEKATLRLKALLVKSIGIIISEDIKDEQEEGST